MKRIGNPFLDDFAKLVSLDSRDCADASVVESVHKLDSVGQAQYQSYVPDVIEKRCLVSVYEGCKLKLAP